MAALQLDQIYTLSSSPKIVEVEKELEQELNELTTELEECEMKHGVAPKITSSVPLPKNVEHFRRERELIIKRTVEVGEAQPLRMQAEEMRMEMAISETPEYTVNSLPMLLLQHFLERIQNLVGCKHLHMLRWRRFCEHTTTIEQMYPLYNERMAQLMKEYQDCLKRAQRLSEARENYLAGKSGANVALVTQDDLLIYLRWLVCHQRSLKRFNQFLKVLQWLPLTHADEIKPPKESEQEEETNASKMADRYRDETYSPPEEDGLNLDPTELLETPYDSSSTPPAVSLHYLTSFGSMSSSAMLYTAAATGGGLASNENSLTLPLNYTDFDSIQPLLTFFLNIYGINFDLNSIQNSSDEMEMFAEVLRKYKHFFTKQEQLQTFRTYDYFESGTDNSWGHDNFSRALLKESNWLPFVTLTPENDPVQEKRWTDLRHENKVDEILKVMAHFLKVKDHVKVKETLREHCSLVNNVPKVQAVSVTSHKTGFKSRNMWKKIYANPNLYTDEVSEQAERTQDFDEKETESVNLYSLTEQRQRKESYDYINTMQMLGLDDGENASSGDPMTVQGSYLSFLHLRHLRVRDLQRTCLSVLNYFRSVERTITISDRGLSLEGNSAKKGSQQNHRFNTEMEGTVGGGGGIQSHAYLHNNPVDFRVSELEFMQFSEVENHDDFYTVEEGRVHVQDHKGLYIMYDSALSDFSQLETDLLLLATHFIEKDRNLHMTRKPDSIRRHINIQDAGDFDIASYGHQNIDRFGVLLDLWTNECAFLERKRELLDCYFEAYQHVTDRDEKRRLAETLTHVFHRRPRFDFEAPYFVKAYRTECSILQNETSLVKDILDTQIGEQRVYTQRVCREGEALFGLPISVIPKQPVSINLSRPALKNIFMLEFHPSLSIASRIPKALKYANWEFKQLHRPKSLEESLVMEKKLLEVAQQLWNSLPNIGATFSPHLNKDLFSGIYVEDPLFMCELAQHQVSQQEKGGTKAPHKERHAAMVQAIARVMETVTLRHRLLEACWESEILSDLYLKQAKEMGYDACHMFVRLVQFEYASFRHGAEKPPPIFITSVQENEALVDKYSPTFRNLAIHELDESHVGRFSFRTRDAVLNVLRPGGVESLQVVLKSQVLHKNALTSAVLQASACHPLRQPAYTSAGNPMEVKSERSSGTQVTATSSALGTSGSRSATLVGAPPENTKLPPEAFMSLQLEKTPSRDQMLNEYLGRRGVSSTKSAEEMENAKRKFISNFCETYHVRMAQTSLRGQILAYYNSIRRALEDFPSLRETYFMEGFPNEKKDSIDDDVTGLNPDPRDMKRRPRRLLSPDGQRVLNLWFLPHYTEVLIMFKYLEDEQGYRALAFTLSIVSSLHDFLHYLCALARLGTSHAMMGSRRMEFVSADWGGAEGIGSELRALQKRVDHLNDPTDPNQVQELLFLQRDVLFLKFDMAVRHSMMETFIASGNMQAFKSVKANMPAALAALSNVQRASLLSMNFTVPEPLEPRDNKAQLLVPWRAFIGRYGPFPCMYWQWSQIAHNIQLCLCSLRDVDRHTANGEILGVTLLMEDVMQVGYHAVKDDSKLALPMEPKACTSDFIHVSHRMRGVRHAIAKFTQTQVEHHKLPLEVCRLLKYFLLLWKCLEILKHDWGCRRLTVEAIDCTTTHRNYMKLYRVEVLLPVLQSIARRLGQGEMYNRINPEIDMIVVPKGASEVEVRSKQLTRVFEHLEVHMINEVRKRVARELTLALAEKSRGEEQTLTTDIWKKSMMKESFTVSRPHLVEDFASMLMSDAEVSETQLTFPLEHVQACMDRLGRQVLLREKECFQTYSVYYESVLRSHHQLLYKSEQKVKELQHQLKQAHTAVDVQASVQIASHAYDLLMEVTALRAKIMEMREQAMTSEQDTRESVKNEMKEAMQNMLGVHIQLRARFDKFREDLHDDTLEKIMETRNWAVETMDKLQDKYSEGRDDNELRVNQQRAQQLRNLQNENKQLHTAITKMKAMMHWKCSHLTTNFQDIIGELKRDKVSSKKEILELQMLAEEQVVLLRQQLMAIKKALSTTESEAAEVRKLLNKELKRKKKQEFEMKCREQDKLMLEGAKQAGFERVLEELQDKEERLKRLMEENDRSSKLQQLAQEKVRRDIDTIKRRLTHERSLKLNAFQRVDQLQSQVYDYESSVFGTSQFGLGTPAIPPPSTSGRSVSRATSAAPSRHPTRPFTSTGVRASASNWPANRAPSLPDEEALLNNMDHKKIQRPKTVGSRLRSRVTEQLLNDLDPDHQRTIVQLEEMKSQRSNRTSPPYGERFGNACPPERYENQLQQSSFRSLE